VAFSLLKGRGDSKTRIEPKPSPRVFLPYELLNFFRIDQKCSLDTLDRTVNNVSEIHFFLLSP
jgi:hypothetical protein